MICRDSKVMALCAPCPSLRPFDQIHSHHAEILHCKHASIQASCQARKSLPDRPQNFRGGCRTSFLSSNAGAGSKFGARIASKRICETFCRERSPRLSIDCKFSSSQPVSDESDMAPQVLASQFPWKSLLNRMVEKVLSLVEKGIKWVAIPFIAIVLFAELSYSWREGKALLFFVGLVLGSSLATLLKELYEEFATTSVVGGLPLHIVGIALLFTLLQAPGPAYPAAWLRVLLPAIGNGGLWTAGLLLVESRRVSGGTTS